ncbi:MAG: tetratricopeptide repeat protein [Geobacteraceae bacterium]|nr:tetratricopeptide repeat protein [Geobacteraceae bacterium]
MKPLAPQEAVLVFERARRAIAMDNSVAGLAALEKALTLEDNKGWYSYLGYCVAKERGQVSRGVELCLESLEHEPNNPAHHLNLGKIYLVSGNRAEALRIFRQGMTRGGSSELIEKLNEFGKRKAPLIPFLSRANPVNKFLGLLLRRIGLR